MIDPSIEKLVPLIKAARALPSARTENGMDVSTLHRWARDGVRGHKLEVIRVGGTACTSWEALGRFFEATSKGKASAPPNARPSSWTKEVLAKNGLDQPARMRKPKQAKPEGDREDPDSEAGGAVAAAR
jgi:hypothetical protein